MVVFLLQFLLIKRVNNPCHKNGVALQSIDPAACLMSPHAVRFRCSGGCF
jgi:hypothetical protein